MVLPKAKFSGGALRDMHWYDTLRHQWAAEQIAERIETDPRLWWQTVVLVILSVLALYVFYRVLRVWRVRYTEENGFEIFFAEDLKMLQEHEAEEERVIAEMQAAHNAAPSNKKTD